MNGKEIDEFVTATLVGSKYTRYGTPRILINTFILILYKWNIFDCNSKMNN